jgi:Domain of Unknown Function (DUF1080)
MNLPRLEFHYWRILSLVSIVWLLTSCLPNPPAEVWIELFNGKDLTGWKGDLNVWRSENGYISGKAALVKQNTFLIHDTPYSDFVLEAKVLVINAGSFPNSGIQYRSFVIDANTWRVGGYQADVGNNYWGSLDDEANRGILVHPIAAAQQVAKYGEWNQYRITAKGTRLEHEFNGVKSVDFLDNDQTNRRLEGLIALQYHTPGENFEVRYKDIRIKGLSP